MAGTWDIPPYGKKLDDGNEGHCDPRISRGITSSEKLVDLSNSDEEQKAQEREDPLQPTSSPPAVPAWTTELAWDKIKQILKRRLLSLRAMRSRSRVKASASPPDLKQCETILVLRTDRLGDAVLTFPFVQSLKSAVPGAEIIYAVQESWASLFRDQKNVDRVIGIPQSIQQRARILAKARPDLIIDPQTGPIMETALLCEKSGAIWRIGFTGYGRERYFSSYRTPPNDHRHFSDEAFDLLKLWPDLSVRPVITPFLEVPVTSRSWWEARRSEHTTLSSGYICIHPGAFYKTQRWPVDHFLELSERIREELKRAVIWFGSEDVGLSVSTLEDDPGTLCFSNLSIDQLAAVLGEGSVFVGNNSGPLHLACALGIPTVSVMGPTVPYRWWPLGRDHQVARLGVNCSPCNLGWCSHHTCLRAISVDQVFELMCQCLAS